MKQNPVTNPSRNGSIRGFFLQAGIEQDQIPKKANKTHF
jgi:hypothetical protein